jgi:hypothetical protein
MYPGTKRYGAFLGRADPLELPMESNRQMCRIFLSTLEQSQITAVQNRYNSLTVWVFSLLFSTDRKLDNFLQSGSGNAAAMRAWLKALSCSSSLGD